MRDVVRKGAKLARLLTRSTFRRGLRFGVAASIESLAALKTTTVRTVIDVGANVGQFSLLMTELNPEAAIHAFEPLPASALVFERLFADRPRVHLDRLAIGDEDGTATLRVSRRPDNSSLLPTAPAQLRFAPGTETATTLEVEVRRLDGLIDPETIVRPALLKLDVQGGELAALRGAERLLGVVDHVYVEVSFFAFYEGQPTADRILAHLMARGFGLSGLGGIARLPDGRIAQTDLLMSRGPGFG